MSSRLCFSKCALPLLPCSCDATSSKKSSGGTTVLLVGGLQGASEPGLSSGGMKAAAPGSPSLLAKLWACYSSPLSAWPGPICLLSPGQLGSCKTSKVSPASFAQ